MTDTTTTSGFRSSFLPRLPEHDIAADLLGQAADALLAGDMPVLWTYAYSLVGPINPKTHRQSKMTRDGLPKEALASSRMPGSSVIRDLHERDGLKRVLSVKR